MLSHQDGHQCSCVVIESSFDPGERLQAPGSLLYKIMFSLQKGWPYGWETIVSAFLYLVLWSHLKLKLDKIYLSETYYISISSETTWTIGTKLDRDAQVWVHDFMVLILNSTWLSGPIVLSDWLKFQTFSSQKLLVKFDCDIVGMFIRWFSTNFKFLTKDLIGK